MTHPLKDWFCTFCGKEANQHYCTEFTNHIHIYFCNNCYDQFKGWRYLRNKKLKKWLATRPYRVL